MDSGREVRMVVKSALVSAWRKCKGDEEYIRRRGPRHRNRSSEFVNELGLLLDAIYDGDEFAVHRIREDNHIDDEREVLHDIDVIKRDADDLLVRNLWQIESEFAYKGSNPMEPEPLRDVLVYDLNKLMCGFAENSVLITSIEWLDDDKTWFIDILQRAARRWHSGGFGRGFYVCLVPFVSKWHALEREDLVCRVFRFVPKTRRYKEV